MNESIRKSLAKANMTPEQAVEHATRRADLCDELADWFTNRVFPGYLIQGTCTPDDLRQAVELVGALSAAKSMAKVVVGIVEEEYKR